MKTNVLVPTDRLEPTVGRRVGVDLVSVKEVEESLRRFGRRYLARIYTETEIRSCQRVRKGAVGYAVDSLAARFAAKEAVVKVLRPDGVRPAWRTIEVVRHEAGWCTIRLSGLAEELSLRAGIRELSVSLTHDGEMAAAVVVATGPSELLT